MAPLLLTLTLISAGQAPEWDKSTIRNLLTRVQMTQRAPTVQAKDTELANVGGAAYNVSRKPSEPNETYAKRVLRKRDPEHPNVKTGQWLSALMRVFYQDVSKRTDQLSRFETDRNDRRYLEQMSKESKMVAEQIATTLELVVEGLEGVVEPLPIAPGSKPKDRGAMAMVRQQKINIENLDRITFSGHQPPADAQRTARGSLREIMSAQKQYNISAQMLGKYEKKWRQSRGHVRIVVPSGYPAIYLNEIVRGGIEAKMHTAHIMTMTKRGDLREIALKVRRASLKKKKKKKKRKKKAQEIAVTCRDDMTMQICVQKLIHAQTLGRPVYEVP